MAEKGCSKCKQNTVKLEKRILFLSIFILGTSVYGTVELLKKIIELIK